MVRKILVGAALFLAYGCGSKAAYSAHSGSVALSNDGTKVYAVDTDHNMLEVVDPTSLSVIEHVPVGASPARIAIGNDDRIYVTNRGERTVSVVDPKSFKEITRVAVGVEPTGISMSSDGSKVYVVSATDLNDTTQGTLSEIDVSNLSVNWTVKVGEEARGVAIAGGKAYVSNLKQGRVAVVDLSTHQLVNSVSLNDGPDSDPTVTPNSAVAPGGAADVVVSPKGDQVFVPHVWQLDGSLTNAANQAPTPDGISTGGGSTYGGGSNPQVCGSTAIVSPGVSTISTSNDSVQVQSLACGSSDSTTAHNFPSPVIANANQQVIAQSPSTALVDPTGTWLFVASQSVDDLVIMPINRNAAAATAVEEVGSGVTAPNGGTFQVSLALSNPQTSYDKALGVDGIALSPNGQTAYVYSQLAHTLFAISQAGSDPSSLQVSGQSKLEATEVLTPAQVLGRQMFYSAVNASMTSPGVGIACISCHLEGREDGHVWQFPDGPRQTPSLAGREISKTAPYHWAGIFPTLRDFYAETIVDRMGGTGISEPEAANLTAYVESIPKPDNALQNRPDLAASQARGQQAFAKAGCNACHTGEALTNNQFRDVGTLTSKDLLELVDNGTVQGFVPLTAVNVPSLMGISRTAPYLHDGSVPTIQARIDQSRSSTKHGDTSQLSGDEVADLTAYLYSL